MNNLTNTPATQEMTNNSTLNGAPSTPSKKASGGSNPLRFNLHLKGLTEAINHNGNVAALKNFLILIREGQWLDDRQDDSSREALRNQKRETQDRLRQEKQELDAKAKRIAEHDILNAEREIQDMEMDREALSSDQVIKSYSASFRPVLAWLMVGLSILLGIFLWLFYASAADSAFFRNLGDEAINAGGLDDLDNLLNGFFNPDSAFSWQKHSPFIFLFVTIFFALGLLPHLFYEKSFKGKWIVVVIAALIPLFADFLLAYKIEGNLAMMDSLLSGENVETHFSINFWLVIVSGYLAYMAWGFLLFFTFDEFQKRNPANLINAQIALVETQIRRVRNKLGQMRQELADTMEKSQNKGHEIQLLSESINSNYIISSDELQMNIASFFNGWLTGLAQADLMQTAAEAQRAVDEFRGDLRK